MDRVERTSDGGVDPMEIAGTIHDARHTRDTVTVTGSARKPIRADLVQWRLTVAREAAEPAPAARRLHRAVREVVRRHRRVGEDEMRLANVQRSNRQLGRGQQRHAL